ncbi:MAG: cysteine synthase [Candidatus Proteinoplasmatales archaeon SG8-5]|nr:MAG: cysteine synthase [Candidatus Proteinoplasmatales archaeon SG8-5]
MEIKESIVDCIGNTPLVYLDRFARGSEARIAAKLEMFNPFSMKDRPVLYMINEAERRGQITKDTTIIEASSGNTAIALASICAMKGYRLIICMSEIQSLERRKIIKAFGAELVLTPKEKGTLGAREKAKELHEEISDSYYICQHSNPDNILAHAETTAEELWRDTDGRMDALVAGLGTTGTASGVSKVLKPRRPELRIIGIEPANAPFLSRGIFNPHRMMGTAPGWVPDLYDESLVDEIVLVSEEDAFAACRRLARDEGILVGITSGATAHASLELAKRPGYEGKLIVCMFADSGERYLSVDGLF